MNKTSTVEWRSLGTVPDIPEGSHQEVLVVAKAKKDGAFYVYGAEYLNEFPLLYPDDHECNCPEGLHDRTDGCCPTTGWFEDAPNDDYDRLYTKLSLESDYRIIVAWAYMPAYSP